MKSNELYSNFNEEVKQQFAGYKTEEEAKKVLSKVGIEPLRDVLLDKVAGGRMGDGSSTTSKTPYTPRDIT